MLFSWMYIIIEIIFQFSGLYVVSLSVVSILWPSIVVYYERIFPIITPSDAHTLLHYPMITALFPQSQYAG